MKRVARVLAILVAVLLVIAVSLPFLIDANQFRPRLEAELTKALGRGVKLGDLKLSILSGGVTATDLSIADDPSFSKNAFVSAKSLAVGVELQPLIFSKKLNVTGIKIDRPEISLIQSASGAWNFSSLGGKSSTPKTADPPSNSPPPDLSVKLVKITGGRISLKKPGDPQPQVLDKVNLQVDDFSAAASFPFSLTATIQGGGDLKLDGKAGPLDSADLAATPFQANLKLSSVDLVPTGFVRASTGFGGVVSIDGSVTSNGRAIQVKGAIKADKLKIVKGGTPARKPVAFDFTLNHDTLKHSGTLSSGVVHIGGAQAALTGTYRLEGAETLLNMKLAAPSMAVSELVEMLPPLDVVLPNGSSLQGGTLTTNLTVEGPTDKLVAAGSLALKNTKLAGFDLGSKLKTIATIAGIKVARDTDFQNLSADIHSDPAVTRVENISVIAQDIGELTGAGTRTAAHALDFKMRAKLRNSGGVMSYVSTNGEATIPFSIQGTSSDPKFVPDVKGMATEKLKSLATPETGKAVGGIINGLFGRKKTN
jgi:AsmA protein